MQNGTGGGLRAVLELRPGPEATAEQHEDGVRRLRATLLDLDVESVSAVHAGDVPDGAKAADPLTLGALMVVLAAPGGVLTTLIGVVNDWLARQRSGQRISVTIDGDTLELDGALGEERRELIAAFLARRNDTGRPGVTPAADSAEDPAEH